MALWYQAGAAGGQGQIDREPSVAPLRQALHSLEKPPVN
jgi:hypothetical protein